MYEITTIDACIDQFETQLIPIEMERYSGGVDNNHLFFDNHHDVGNIKLALINTPKFSYYDSDLPTVNQFVTAGRYTLCFDPKTNDI